MPDSDASITRHLRVHGRVQGVYYRQSMIEAAQRLGVHGWVRNRHDGSVEALATGPASAVQALMDVAAGGLLVTEAGGLVGNFTGEADYLEQRECLAGSPRIYGQLVGLLGKYSKFASAGDKAAVRQATEEGDAQPEAPADDAGAADGDGGE